MAQTIPWTPPEWNEIGETSDSRIYEVEAGIVAIVPYVGCDDTEATALEKTRVVNEHYRRAGRKGTVLVFVDPIRRQDRSARRVYQDDSVHNPLVLGTALVGNSALGRAIGSFFLGFAKLNIPLQMFATLEDALPWCRAINTEAGQTDPEKEK